MSFPASWIKVKFSQIAKRKSIRTSNPKESKYERYVGLEHLDSGELVVKRWGSTQDVSSSMKLFNKNDILFARRNTYLRRVSVAPFEGVCSGDIIVIEPVLKHIVNGFLPIYMQFEEFENRVVAWSAGAFSKRIKWKQLSDFEVWLPPKEEQQNIVNMIWSIQVNQEKIENLIQVAEKLKKGLLEELLTKGIGHSKFKKTQLGKIRVDWELKPFFEIMRINPESLSNKTSDDYELEYIDIASISSPNVISRTEKYRFEDAPSRARRIVRKRDVIISTVRPYLKAFALINEDKGNLVCSTGFAVLRETDSIRAEYIFHFCLSKLFEEQSNMFMSGSNYPALNSDDLKKFLIPLPTIKEQEEIICLLEAVDKKLTALYAHCNNLSNLRKKLTNSFLRGEIIL